MFLPSYLLLLSGNGCKSILWVEEHDRSGSFLPAVSLRRVTVRKSGPQNQVWGTVKGSGVSQQILDVMNAYVRASVGEENHTMYSNFKLPAFFKSKKLRSRLRCVKVTGHRCRVDSKSKVFIDINRLRISKQSKQRGCENPEHSPQ